MQAAGQSMSKQWPTVWDSASWKPNRQNRRTRVEPPPGLGTSSNSLPGVVKKVLQGMWSKLEDADKDSLKAVGCDFEEGPPVPDLKTVCQANLEHLPEAIRKLVREPVKEPPSYSEAVSILNKQFKAETSQLREMVQQSATLQEKINKAKATYQELLKDMQSLTEKLTAKQQEVEVIQRKLQTKLAEAECTKPEPLPDETSSFTALFEALAKAGLQLDAEAQAKVQQHLSLAENSGCKRRKVETEAPVADTGMQG